MGHGLLIDAGIAGGNPSSVHEVVIRRRKEERGERRELNSRALLQFNCYLRLHQATSGILQTLATLAEKTPSSPDRSSV
ncbi:hypothetical protein ISN44_As09g012610 [Arabidopsis suecica]|uniref:Uncharacterized protein n=1 Tax=Arabidopsis suecica TaxID=45249 RepID=A0A8T2AHA0_ARASU|nr:hypothetical protein ISN44_As09g012610 [Arabidopsis suecica]